MHRPDFLKLVRQIERHWDTQIDRAAWWPHFKGEPAPIVWWKLKRAKAHSVKPPVIPQLASGIFTLEELPDHIAIWWQEHWSNAWPLMNGNYVKPEKLSGFHRRIIRLGRVQNDWNPLPSG